MTRTSIARARYQFVTYWKATGLNSQGETTVASPVELKVRIEKGLRETIDPQGNVVASALELNVGEEIPVGSLIWIGKKKDLPNPVPEVYQVIDYEEIPGVKARKIDRYVKLMRHGNREPILT